MKQELARDLLITHIVTISCGKVHYSVYFVLFGDFRRPHLFICVIHVLQNYFSKHRESLRLTCIPWSNFLNLLPLSAISENSPNRKRAEMLIGPCKVTSFEIFVAVRFKLSSEL